LVGQRLQWGITAFDSLRWFAVQSIRDLPDGLYVALLDRTAAPDAIGELAAVHGLWPDYPLVAH
jgi:hypothetical protein